MKCNEISAKLDRFPCSSGDPKRQLYKAEVARDGSVKLIEAGFQDTDQFIESFRESTELKTLIARYEAGDMTALNPNVTFFADVSELPDNLQEAFEVFKIAQNAFDYVSPQVKEAYGNDFLAWIQDFGSDGWLDSVGLVKEQKVEEVPSDES